MLAAAAPAPGVCRTNGCNGSAGGCTPAATASAACSAAASQVIAAAASTSTPIINTAAGNRISKPDAAAASVDI